MRIKPWCLAVGSLFTILWSVGMAMAEIRFNPETMMPTAELRQGMKGYCKTVLQGTKIEAFGVEILGVLENQWYGGDIILFRITDGVLVERELGIVSGMSGSPIYVDGKLVGAVSLSFAGFMKEPMGGATPIEQMLEASPKSAPVAMGPVPLEKPLRVDGKTFRHVEVVSNSEEMMKPAEDTLVLRPVLTPLLISGVRPERISDWDNWLRGYGFRALPGGGPMPDGPEVELEPGSALGVELASGDISITGVGTLTYREGEEFLAFGHSLDQMGSVAIPVGTAYVHGVVATQMDPFKLASPIRTVGSLSQDRPWAIGGTIGPIPPRIPFSLQARNESKGLERKFNVLVTKEQTYTLMALFGACDEALLSLSDVFGDQSATVRTRVKPEGMEAIEVTDFLSSSETGGFWWSMPVWYGASDSLVTIFSMLDTNPYKRVGVEEVSVEVEMVDESHVANIEKAQLDRLQYRPGEEVTVHLTIRPWQGERQFKDVSFTVPENIMAGPVEIEISGGASGYYDSYGGLLQPTYDDLPGMMKSWLEQRNPGNALLVTTSYQTYGLSSPEGLMHYIPAHVTNLLYRTGKAEVYQGREWNRKTTPTEWYLSGDVYLTITVEKEKWAPPMPGGPPGGPPGGFPGGPPGMRVPPGEEYYSGSSASPAPLVAYATPHWLRADSQRWPRLGSRFAEQARRTLFGRSEGGVVMPRHSLGHLERPLVLPTVRPPRARPVEPVNGEPPSPPMPTPGMKGPTPEMMEQYQAMMEQEAAHGGEEAVEGEEEEEEEGELVGRQATVAGWATAADFSAFKFEGTYASEGGRIQPMPAVAKIAEIPEGTAWSVVADARGNIYVGTGPKGRIYQFSAKGEQKRVVETGQLMVNALAVSPKGKVFAGTSPGAKVFAFTRSGKAKLFCDLPGEHVWALRFDAEGNLLAATGGEKGALYSITSGGSSSVIYEPEDSHHIICMELDTNGGIYLGTAEPGHVIMLDRERRPRTLYEAGPESPTQEVLALGKWKGSVVFSTPDPGLFRVTETGALEPLGMSSGGGDPEGPPPGAGGPAPFVTALTAVPEGLLLTSGDQTGGVWILSGETTLTNLTSFYGSQLTGAFTSATGRAYFCGNNPVAVYAAQSKEGSQATATSPPYDTGRLSRWGRAFWRAELPPGSAVLVMSRSGNTSSPDTTWSDWSFPRSRPTGHNVSCPPARFIQFKVDLVSGYGGEMPALDGLFFVFLPANQEPQLQITEPGRIASWSGKKTLLWNASDPDGDTLAYSIYLSSDGGQNWEELKKDLTDQSYDWETKEKEDGTYLLKVVATDRRANPDDPKQTEKVSGVVHVDNTPPVILRRRSKGTLSDGKYSYEGVAIDRQTSIRAVEYRLDEGEWQAAVALDGIFDSRSEKFRFEIESVPGGKHKLEAAAVDEARNRKSETQEIEGYGEAPPEVEEGEIEAMPKEGVEETPPEESFGGLPPEAREQMEGYLRGQGPHPEAPSTAPLPF